LSVVIPQYDTRYDKIKKKDAYFCEHEKDSDFLPVGQCFMAGVDSGAATGSAAAEIRVGPADRRQSPAGGQPI
jgi:hypothetical protein